MDRLAHSQTIINSRERPLSQDINELQSQLFRTLRETVGLAYARRTTVANDVRTLPTGFFGDSFKVRPKSPASMIIEVTSGLGLMPNPDADQDLDGILGLDDLASVSPIFLSATQEFTVPAAPGVGNARWDIIMVKATREIGNSTSRDVLDGSGVFAAQMVDKTMKFDVLAEVETIAAATAATAALVYKYGVVAAAGAEVEPTTDAGYVKIAGVRVGASVTAIEANKLIDYRRYLAPDGVFKASIYATWTSGPGTMPAVFKALLPAGAEATILRTSAGVGNEYRLYIKAGGADAADVMIPNATGRGITAGGQPQDFIASQAMSVATVDSTIQTNLAGADSANPLAVAIGQKVYWLDLYFYQQTVAAAPGPITTTNTGAALANAVVNVEISILPQ